MTMSETDAPLLSRAQTGVVARDDVLEGGLARNRLQLLEGRKRTGVHEDTIREFQIASRGITVGPPLHKFHGVPTYVGASGPLMRDAK